jgi:hypothetical protein
MHVSALFGAECSDVLILGYEGCMHVRLRMDLLCMYVVLLVWVLHFFFGREMHGIGA